MRTMPEFRTEQKILAGFVLSFLLLVGVGILGYRIAKSAIETARWVTHSQEVLNQLERVLSGVQGAESGLRGFLLTGQPDFVPRYEAALADAQQGIDHVNMLTRDNPIQQGRANRLRALLAQASAGFAQITQSRKTQTNSEPAIGELLAEENVIKNFRALVAETETEERQLLVTRSARTESQATKVIAVILLTNGLAACFVVMAIILIHLDFSARKRVQEERDRFFNLSQDLLCIAGTDGFFKALNPAWEKALGFTREEMLSRPFLEFVHPDDLASTTEQTGKLAAGGEVLQFENRYRCKDGTYRWLSWKASAFLPAKLIYGTARDVTGRKISEKRIADLNQNLHERAEQLEAANKELEAFSYSVSHDLRAPLRHMSSFVQLLKTNPTMTPDQDSLLLLDNIARAARQMGRLVDDLLGFSRMARAEMIHQKVDLNELVTEVKKELEAESSDRHVEWVMGALPIVEADQAMLRIVFTNLLSNALKYSRPRSIAKIEVGASETASEHIIFVADNGVGFEMRFADKLFGVFQRLHDGSEFEGTGIGLANVSRIILRHGGRVWAESELEKGSKFYFSLPKR
jgi:PAS domain S-box-containing protein